MLNRSLLALTSVVHLLRPAIAFLASWESTSVATTAPVAGSRTRIDCQSAGTVEVRNTNPSP